MKRFTLTNIAVILGTLACAMPVLAATTASLSPASVAMAPGQKFNVVITVNPQGTSNYVEKLEINYPADLIEAASFAFGSNWMPLTQPGYDSTDNSNGVMIKTAGYPGGLTSSAVFGTVSFSAKKAGSGTIKIGNASLAFEANSQTAITGSPTSFAVTAPVAPAPTTAPAKAAVQKTPATAPVQTQQVTETAPVQPTAQVEQTSQLAAVTNAVPQGSSNTWVWILAIIAIVLIGGYLLVRSRERTGN